MLILLMLRRLLLCVLKLLRLLLVLRILVCVSRLLRIGLLKLFLLLFILCMKLMWMVCVLFVLYRLSIRVLFLIVRIMMCNRSYYIGCFVKTSDSTAHFQVKWIGSFYEKAVRLLQTHFSSHLLLDDRMLHYLLSDDDVYMDWTQVKEIYGNA